MRRFGILAVLAWSSCGGQEGDVPGDCGDFSDNDRDGLVDCFDDSCAASSECRNGAIEGAEPGECSDNIDNDGDQAIDCEDDDCLSEVDCGDLADQGAFVHPELNGVDLTFKLTIKLRTLGGAEAGDNPFCNDIFKLCDCELSYAGSGSFVDGAGIRGTFQGTYERVGAGAPLATDGKCNASLLEAVYPIRENIGVSVFHTFRWSTDGSTLQEWIVHEDEAKNVAIPVDDSPRDNKQFYLTQMDQPHGAVVDYFESGSVDDSQNLVTTYTISEFHAEFR
ncbi:MAG: hypothetical protein RLZZ383_307 [Pseudomonadota bacterium]|jgi:hypothetical protein